MACLVAPAADRKRASSLCSCRGWTEKGVFLFVVPFVFCLCFFVAPVPGQKIGRPAHYDDCAIDCAAIGGICVPDLSPGFGKLLAHRHSGSFPFRCQAKQEDETLVAETSQEGDVGYNDNDNFNPNDFLLATDGCPYDCQNGGTCISIFGGLSFACICVEPFWGSECEFDGLEEACELDCAGVVESTGSPGAVGVSNDDSRSRQGAFCAESPENIISEADFQTCVHCEAISEDEEPRCDDLMVCKNGGACKIEYQFVTAVEKDSNQANAASVERRFKCSSSTSIPIVGEDGSTVLQTVWMDLPPYVLSCDCQPGFQGETCEEIDVCGTGCQNDGYCISKDTPDETLGSDTFFSLNTDDSVYDDDIYFDFDHNDDDLALPADSSNVDCTCFEGHCNQVSCGANTSCVGGMCIQDNLIRPTCSGGKCSQRRTQNPSCGGGDCDQTAAVEATCDGSDCFRDEVEAQTLIPDTNTMSPDFGPFCSCEYGYFGELCQHTITAICLFDEYGYNQLLHDVCLQLGGLCPLDVGDRFCTNGGSCGNLTGTILPAVSTTTSEADEFSCDCPIGFEGVHCELVRIPEPKPISRRDPNTIVPISSSSSNPPLLTKWSSALVLFSVSPYLVNVWSS